MSDQRQTSGAGTWGCLSAAMIVLGVFTIVVFEGVGGADYEVEYMAAASALGGAIILLLLVIQSRSKEQGLRLPRLHPAVAFAVLAVISYLLLF